MDILSLAVILSFLTLVLSAVGVFRIIGNYDQQINRQSSIDAVVEGLFVYVFPPLGLIFTSGECELHPFDVYQQLTPWVLWFLFAAAHFLSKLWKKYLSFFPLLLISSLMLLGVLFCLAICIHFLPHSYIALIPGFQLAYLAPLFCLLYLLREIYNLNRFLGTALTSAAPGSTASLKPFSAWLQRYSLGFSIYLLAPVLALLQSFLYLAGQRSDSLISQFTSSCGFLLSYDQQCNCLYDHSSAGWLSF